MFRHSLSTKLQTAVREALENNSWDKLFDASQKIQDFLDRLAESKAKSIESRRKDRKKLPVSIDDILRLRAEGLSFTKIGQALNCSQSLVYKTWKSHAETKKRQ